MLTAGGRAPPFGDLAKCATAAGADAGTTIQRSNIMTGDISLRLLFGRLFSLATALKTPVRSDCPVERD